jgi:hypothetical protein
MNSPLSNTYWVVPGRLLAGEHPYGRDDEDARNRIRFLLAVGINYFIDLTQPYEVPEYRHLLPADTKYLRSPIADVEVPSEVAQMRDIQKRIRAPLPSSRGTPHRCARNSGFHSMSRPIQDVIGLGLGLRHLGPTLRARALAPQ